MFEFERRRLGETRTILKWRQAEMPEWVSSPTNTRSKRKSSSLTPKARREIRLGELTTMVMTVK
ncbi:unnamed protein product [Linum tenue]|uniref:Uncharacterized protein n=1 Tax=Linum tenue TaxID=586396 RepID=A0AAV0IYS5_9ROSI|nr:unnamed protein product [Linum tenue]